MALIDNPHKWILRLFEMEKREGRGKDCEVFPDGRKIEGIPLEKDEKIYGVFKDKYYFSPLSLIIKSENDFQRIQWKSIASCSSKHGEGKKISELTMTDGSIVTVKIGDLAKGWSGRISQLYHQMIQKYGAQVSFGHPPLSIEHFFNLVSDEYCFAPNLAPHPTLSEIKEAIIKLKNRKEVNDVLIHVIEYEDKTPISNGLIVRLKDIDINIQEIIEILKPNAVIEAPEEIKNFFNNDDKSIKFVLWD